MHIERRKPGQIQHGRGQQQAVSGHHQHVRRVSAQPGHGGGIFKIFRLFHGQAQFQSGLLHGRHGEPVPAPGGPVRLGIDGDERAVRPGGQAAQRGHGEIRRAHKN